MSKAASAKRGEPPRYHVDVIELDPSLRKGEKPAVDVGETHSRHRSASWRHKAGKRSSKWARQYGIALRPRLDRNENLIASRNKGAGHRGKARTQARARGDTVSGGD